jgi:hypothetical protein
MEIIAKLLAIFGLIALVAALAAFPVMWLWNWLMPTLFGLREVSALQALGLSLLCSILFKGSASSSSK